jgi:hypothetical protein
LPVSLYNFLISTAEHPFLLFLAWSCGVTVIWMAVRRRPMVGSFSPTLLALLAAVTLAGFGAVLVSYAVYPAYFDRVEPSVTSISWLFAARDYPLYHAPEDPRRYAHVYGPILFFVHGAFLRATGPSIEASKIPGMLGAIACLGMLFVALHRSLRDGTGALTLVAVVAVLFLAFQNIAFWNRPDPFILVLVTAAAMLARWQRTAGLLGVAACAALATNLKISAPMYFVPLLPGLVAVHGLRALVWGFLAFVIVLAAPFAHSAADAEHYLFWLFHGTGGGELDVRGFALNLEWAVLLVTPLALARGARQAPLSRVDLLEALLLLVALLVTATIAAIPGAGPYHLLPYAPIVFLAASRVARRPPMAHASRRVDVAVAVLAAAATLSVLTVAAIQQYRFLAALDWQAARALAKTLEEIRTEFTGRRVALGYSGDRPLPAMFRPMFVFDADPFLFDAPAIAEHQVNGVEIPAATAHALQACAIEVLLFRSDAPPFTTRNIYPASGFRGLFAGDFHDAFQSAFTRDGTRGLFDVWRCRE